MPTVCGQVTAPGGDGVASAGSRVLGGRAEHRFDPDIETEGLGHRARQRIGMLTGAEGVGQAGGSEGELQHASGDLGNLRVL